MRPSTILVGVAVLIGCILSGGCTTFRSPRALNAEEQSIVAQAGLSEVTLGVIVDANDRPAFRNEIVEALRCTRLFKAVNTAEADGFEPNIIVRVRSTGHQIWCLTGPASLVIPTLGLIPVKLPHDTSAEFEFSSPSGLARTVVSYESKLSKWWGATSSLLALSRNWTLNEPDRERHIQRLAYALASRRAEITAVLVRKGGS